MDFVKHLWRCSTKSKFRGVVRKYPSLPSEVLSLSFLVKVGNLKLESVSKVDKLNLGATRWIYMEKKSAPKFCMVQTCIHHINQMASFPASIYKHPNY
jgi:hypothetical protein